jgi:hypothetical protein
MSLISAFDNPRNMENSHPLLYCRIHNTAKFEAHKDIYKLNFELSNKEKLMSLVRNDTKNIQIRQPGEEGKTLHPVSRFSRNKGH